MQQHIKSKNTQEIWNPCINLNVNKKIKRTKIIDGNCLSREELNDYEKSTDFNFKINYNYDLCLKLIQVAISKKNTCNNKNYCSLWELDNNLKFPKPLDLRFKVIIDFVILFFID